MNSIITGIGSFIPSNVAPNEGFEKSEFYNLDGSKFGNENTEIIEKFKAITGIEERRYIKDNLVTSEIAMFAAEFTHV